MCQQGGTFHEHNPSVSSDDDDDDDDDEDELLFSQFRVRIALYLRGWSDPVLEEQV